MLRFVLFPSFFIYSSFCFYFSFFSIFLPLARDLLIGDPVALVVAAAVAGAVRFARLVAAERWSCFGFRLSLHQQLVGMFSACCHPSVQSSSKQDYSEDTRKKGDVRRGGSQHTHTPHTHGHTHTHTDTRR